MFEPVKDFLSYLDLSYVLSRCLAEPAVKLLNSDTIRQRLTSSTMQVLYQVPGSLSQEGILKIYLPDDVGTQLEMASKVSLACRELTHFGIPVSRVIGDWSGKACHAILFESYSQLSFSTSARLQAAQALSRLHQVRLETLSPKLQRLIISAPENCLRVQNAVRELSLNLDRMKPEWRQKERALSLTTIDLLSVDEPTSKYRCLVHGDYFSKNILATGSGVRIIDWDQLAVGDPMWDLGFLLGADQDILESEALRILQAYQDLAPVDLEILSWHRQCWRVSWELRKLLLTR